MLVYRTAVEYELIKSKGIKKNEEKGFLRSLNGRSFCDNCGQQLHWYENVPVMSWVLQQGKSKCCRKKLSVLYPIVEMMMGILFLVHFSVGAGNTPLLLVVEFIIIVFLVFSAVFDLKYMILPDFSTVILVILAVVVVVIGRPQESPLQFVLSAVGSFGFLGLLYLITKGKGMGFGDVKLAIFMGLFLGPEKVLLAFYTAFVIGALVSLGLMILKKANKKTLISFGPFLILGTLVAWFYGDQLWNFWFYFMK